MHSLLFPLLLKHLSKDSVDRPSRSVVLISEVLGNLNLKVSRQCQWYHAPCAVDNYSPHTSSAPWPTHSMTSYHHEGPGKR